MLWCNLATYCNLADCLLKLGLPNVCLMYNFKIYNPHFAVSTTHHIDAVRVIEQAHYDKPGRPRKDSLPQSLSYRLQTDGASPQYSTGNVN